MISSLAMAGKSAEEMIAMAQRNGWPLEFSSGMPYRADMEEIFLTAPVKRFAHNYFPAPRDPFVLNLASSDAGIRERSVGHCLRGLELSKKAGAPFFSAHAGFCLDPQPSELGTRLNLEKPYSRAEHWRHFIDSLKKISEVAGKLNMRFLVENNVLAPVNVHPDGSNPLFCCGADEMTRMLNEVNSFSLDLLLDTGHLKVSAQTLRFDAHEAVRKLINKIGCVHHSDNDGSFDTNGKLGNDYWFAGHMAQLAHVTHVIEVKKLTEEEIKQQIKILA